VKNTSIDLFDNDNQTLKKSYNSNQYKVIQMTLCRKWCCWVSVLNMCLFNNTLATDCII